MVHLLTYNQHAQGLLALFFTPSVSVSLSFIFSQSLVPTSHSFLSVSLSLSVALSYPAFPPHVILSVSLCFSLFLFLCQTAFHFLSFYIPLPSPASLSLWFTMLGESCILHGTHADVGSICISRSYDRQRMQPLPAWNLSDWIRSATVTAV